MIIRNDFFINFLFQEKFSRKVLPLRPQHKWGIALRAEWRRTKGGNATPNPLVIGRIVFFRASDLRPLWPASCARRTHRETRKQPEQPGMLAWHSSFRGDPNLKARRCSNISQAQLHIFRPHWKTDEASLARRREQSFWVASGDLVLVVNIHNSCSSADSESTYGDQ